MIAGLLFATFNGCGAPLPKPPEALPVKGKVTYQNKPLTKGSLIFEPEIGGADQQSDISADGTFTLASGMPPGPYRVYVSGLNKSQIPVKFHNPSSSKTTIEVKPDQSEYNVDFK